MFKTVAAVALCASLCPLSAQAASLATDEAQEWLESQLDVSNVFTLSFTRNKIKFNGCQQKDYRLSLSTQLSEQLHIETLALYGRGVLEFGVFDQRVTSRSYEVITWWQTDDYRYGVATGLRPAHDLELPMSGSFALPDSSTVSVYFETDGFSEEHVMSFALRRETWLGTTSDLALSWDKSYDNQLQLGYRINF